MNKAKPILQLTRDGEFVRRFQSAYRAEDELDIDHSAIHKVLKGKRNFAGGFRWKYENTSNIQ